MRIKQLLSIGLLASFGLTAIAQVASAQTIPMKKDPKGAIVVGGLTPAAKYFVSYPNVPITTKAKADACGWVKIKLPTGVTSVPDTVIFNGVSQSTSEYAGVFGAPPICVEGVQTNTDWNGTSDGQLSNGDKYRKFTAGAEIVFGFPSLPKQRSVKANACGLLRLSPTSAWALPTTGSMAIKTEGGTATATVDTDTIATGYTPKCSSSVLYTPPGWN